MKTILEKKKATALLMNAFKHNDIAKAVTKLCNNTIHDNYPAIGDYIHPVFGFEPKDLEEHTCEYYLDVFLSVSNLEVSAEERASRYYDYMASFAKSIFNSN